MSDLRSTYDAFLRKQALIKQAEETIAAFDKQWLENDYLVLDDLLWVLAEASPDNRKTYIQPIIQSAITNKALTVWDENKSFKLNDKVIYTQYVPRKALVLKQDFIHWWQQEKSVPFPQRLIDLATIATTKTSETTTESAPPKDDLIIKTLLELRYDLMALPVGNGKITGAKADVWGEIGNQFTDWGSFLYYWKKLKKRSRIGDKE